MLLNQMASVDFAKSTFLQALLDDGTFCGLPLDEDNQDDMSADRIKKWVAQIKTEM